MRRTSAAFVLVLLLAGPLRALQNNTGVNGAEFLRLGAGARALGMGEAYGPVAEGADAIYWNPAGLAQAREPHFTYTRTELLRFFHHDFAAYARPVALLGGTVAASYTRLSQDDLPLVTNANVTVGSYSPHSQAAAIAFARAFDLESSFQQDRGYFKDNWSIPGTYRPLTEDDAEPWTGKLMLGLSLKVISETYYEHSATAFAVDGGALFRPVWLEDLSLSFAFRNAGSREKFVSASQNLPAEADFGAAYSVRWRDARLLPALEVALPYYGDPHAKAGIEYEKTLAEKTTVALRAGYKMQSAASLGLLSGFTVGVGTRCGKFAADLGFEPMAALGSVFRLSLGFFW